MIGYIVYAIMYLDMVMIDRPLPDSRPGSYEQRSLGLDPFDAVETAVNGFRWDLPEPLIGIKYDTAEISPVGSTPTESAPDASLPHSDASPSDRPECTPPTREPLADWSQYPLSYDALLALYKTLNAFGHIRGRKDDMDVLREHLRKHKEALAEWVGAAVLQ